jgi:CheY-like chemotaxis protein
MRTKICYLEDKKNVSKTIRKVLNDNYDVLVTDDFRVLADWISDDPDQFDVIIMDLKVPSISMRVLETCKDYDDEHDHSSSLYFIKHFLDVKFKQCIKKIIILSAYLDELSNKGHKKQLEKFITVNKSDPDAIKILCSKINDILKK